MDKIKVGIFLGGNSREREISFAGGRTIYDNLDKALFEAIPIFVDSFGNFVQLDWQYLYKGSIRDFYPPIEIIQNTHEITQLYAENLNPDEKQQKSWLEKIGKPLLANELKNNINFAFLTLHGAQGEDGAIQGLFKWMGIPFSGAGILPSAFGMSKAVQKQLFNSEEKHLIIKKDDWDDRLDWSNIISEEVGFPCVVKSANQGSSIGVSLIKQKDSNEVLRAIRNSFFQLELTKQDWDVSDEAKNEQIRHITDIREGLGLPLVLKGEVLYSPSELKKALNKEFQEGDRIILESLENECEVIVEPYIKGREFSCIVLENLDNRPCALPPTEIVKSTDIYDYKSKYLPGLSRKITPIELEDENIARIRKKCEDLFTTLKASVYARIDGFYTEDGEIILNDPNTTSGMLPSSFFFHQAAEIGLNPGEFITYIIHSSLRARVRDMNIPHFAQLLLNQLDGLMLNQNTAAQEREKVGVIMGGYSFERHISMESGRNIFEKLSSSTNYMAVPIFLTGDADKFDLYKIPISMLLKDNADDIAHNLSNKSDSDILNEIRKECESITQQFSKSAAIFKPESIRLEDLKKDIDGAFIALHGRPGEDGTIQKELEKLGIYYNGSGVESSEITINKYTTKEFLSNNGFSVAKGELVNKTEWKNDAEEVLSRVDAKYNFPLIAKPADDGCSAAVLKIKNKQEFKYYANSVFRAEKALIEDSIKLGIKPTDEFPLKEDFLVEELIKSVGEQHFLEITGGLLTTIDSLGKIEYQIFEPSETLAEDDILSLEEKFLAGQGQNITPPRYSNDTSVQDIISKKVREELLKIAHILNIQGYCRIDAFVRVFDNLEIEMIIIEVNSLPGMTPATCIFHQAALENYKPLDFIDGILSFGKKRMLFSANN